MRHRLWSFAFAAGLLGSIFGSPVRAQEPGPPPAARDSLERRVRQRMAQVIQRQVGLTDEQMRRLGTVNRKMEEQQRALVLRERQLRLRIRDELEAADTTRQAQMSRLLDEMIQVQRQRVDLIEAEQRELATFMSPQQRARYFGMQEQVRRRVEEMRQQGARGGPGGPGGVVPPGARRPDGVLGPGGAGGRPPRSGTRPPR